MYSMNCFIKEVVAILIFSIGTSSASDRRSRERESQRACQSAHSYLIFKCGNPHSSLSLSQWNSNWRLNCSPLQASRWKLQLQDRARVSHQGIAWNVTWREIGAANWIKCDFILWQPWFFWQPPQRERDRNHLQGEDVIEVVGCLYFQL